MGFATNRGSERSSCFIWEASISTLLPTENPEALIEDGFATKMALHCSFEHFEHNADIAFIKEATRVLRKGGKLCIIPLYMFNKYAIQTDPAVLPFRGIPFDKDAVLYCAKGWAERHGRFYDVAHFVSRIVKNMQELHVTIFVVQNEKKVDSSCYVKFIALFEKE